VRSEDNVASLRQMRILHVVGSLNRGGIETWLCQAVTHLPRERYQCDFCTYRYERGAYAAELERSGCEFHDIPLGSSPVAIFRFAKRFRRLLGEGRYDVVHCHGLLLVGFILFLAWMENTPVCIGHSHNTDRKTDGILAAALNRIGLWLNRPLARAFSTHGVACSVEAGAALFGKSWREKSKYTIIRCGIDLAPFEAEADPASWRKALGVPLGAKVIGHVGSFEIVKNQQFLIKMAAHLIAESADVALLLVGDGKLRQSVEQMAALYGIQSRVVFTGVRTDVPQLMLSAMDVFVMPSLHEGLPLVLLEAQAAGLACVVSDAVTREARAQGGSVQFLPLSAGPGAWAQEVLTVLKRPDSGAGLESVRHTDFDISVAVERLALLYCECSAAEDA